MLWAGLGFLLLLILAAGWVGVRAYLAKSELEAAVPLASSVQAAVLAGDTSTADSRGAQLAEHAKSADELTGDPIWRAAEVIPWLGPNLSAMREISESVNDTAERVILPVTQLASTIKLDDFKPADGQINLKPMLDAKPQIVAAASALRDSRERVTNIDGDELIQPLASARSQLLGALDKASTAMNALSGAVQLMPAMLGSEGPRNYLLLFQNNAELRSTGGISGALALIHTDNGTLQMIQQASSTDFPKFDSPVIALTPETRALYGDNTAQFIQDVNFTPKFPLAAEIASTMWTQRFGTQIDGVLAIDPVALSYLLKATGPIVLASGDELTSTNVVSLLLQDVYSRYSKPADQDAFFAAAASAVFERVASGGLDVKKLVSALGEAADERRILLWSVHKEDQEVLSGSTLSGSLPVSDERTQRFGVYLNDVTGAKMDPYLDVKISAGQAHCRADGLPNYSISVTIGNNAPADAATSLPAYVTGGGEFGTAPGTIHTTIAVYGTPGSYNLGVQRDGAVTDYQPASDDGYSLSKVDVVLAPGESARYDFAFLGNNPKMNAIAVQHTPLVNDIETSELTISCENPLK